ncbi:flagellar hook capping FlgD N-terminal domain-containing protein [Sulfitobacter sp. HNIBRBA2951]|uniref:flagellar hook capping FlgD N-terminal domain-containing protein n=1 Tax=Sulfitobacter aquimarinus TaxID=3158557 RepID=UPI0032DE78F3
MLSPTLTSASTTNTVAGAAATSPQADAVLSSDFETFIQMLTTQAKYQDPLEPLDSSDYAAQLAQFSMVEQQVLSNDLLTALGGQLGSGGMGQMAGWIGMEGRTTAPVPFDNTPITVYPTVPIGAQEMSIVVYNDAGAEVDRQPMPVSSDPILWAGFTENGNLQPAGNYRFEIEALGAGGSVLPTAQAETYSRITEVSSVSGEARVIFAGGIEVAASSITALREGASGQPA